MEPNALSLPIITVDTLVDENDGDMSAGDVSLREALAAASTDSTIIFDASLAASNAGAGQGVIQLSLGELTIDKSLNIVGLGADQLTIKGQNAESPSRVFRVDDGDNEATIDVSIEGLMLTNGNASAILVEGENLTVKSSNLTGNGVGIKVNQNPYDYYNYNDISLVVENTTIANNSGAGIVGAQNLQLSDSIVENNAGEGINFEGDATVTRSRISGNRGAGLNSDSYEYTGFRGSGTLSVADSVITGNDGKGIGTRGSVTITNSRIADNQGDGVDNVNGLYIQQYAYVNVSLSITDSEIENNGGHGISSLGSATITNSKINNNTRRGLENGSYNGAGTFTLNNTTVTNNGSSGISAFSISGFGIQLNDSTVINNGGGVSSTGSRYGGSVIANSSVIADNSGSGIFISGGRGGSATVRDSKVTGHSGAGVLADYVTVERSTIADNGAVGLTFVGSATVTSSTLSGNEGGGIFRRSRYAGYYYGTTLTVKNSTISGNGGTSASVGGIENVNSQEYYTHTTRIENSTIANNTGTEVGGIKIETTGNNNYQEAFLKNTIVADNNGTTVDVLGEFDSLGYNLIGDGTGATGFDGPGDLVGTSDNVLNPRLGALKDNGGPTKTQLLLAGSIAVDAGSPVTSSPTFDQRGEGFTRVIDGDNDGTARVDIGAVEVLPARNVINGNRLDNRLVGTNQADLIRGFAGNDRLIGRGGDDVLEGRAGVDRLIGGDGNDRLLGGVGNDILIGGGGNDILNGEVGNDKLRGGSGQDTFTFTKNNEGQDTILDFQLGMDRIDLSAILDSTAYGSATPFEDYIRIGQTGHRNSTVSILDANRSRPGKEVFRDLALVRNVLATELDESNFVL